jgi:hypothetical protein
MPNHFHILIYTDNRSERQVNNNSIITKNVISEGIRLLLSSYAKAINKQEDRTGNLFQQKTRSKAVSPQSLIPGNAQDSFSVYEEICFNYIHLNPIKAGLVLKPFEWQYSSFNEYFGNSSISLCDKEMATKLQLRCPTP